MATEIVATDARLDLQRGEVDIAIRAALPTFAAPVWLCYHESRKDDPLLRTVAGFLGDWLNERSEQATPRSIS